MVKLKNRLATLIEEKQKEGKVITQDKLAAETGVSQSAISRWMGQKVDRFDADIIEKFCVYFDCDVGDLLYIDRGS